MKKRALCLILTLCMVVSLLPMGASAAETVKSGTCGDVKWTYDSEGLLTISGTGEMEDYPYSGYQYPSYLYQTTIKRVVIESGVTSIGECAFFGCGSLESVTIPDSVTRIGRYAFAGCEKLADADGFVLVRDTLYDYYGPGGDVTIPNGVTRIGDAAFDRCDSLASIVIPAGVMSIGDSAFNYCSSLTSVVIPAGVTSIGNDAFSDCTSLTSVTIPDSVKQMGAFVFSSCSSLERVKIPDGVTSIEKYSFSACSSLTSVMIPNSVTEIGAYAFDRCSKLQSVTIPSSVTSIGQDAFYGCSSLKSVEIPDGVTSIGNSAFHKCSSLTSIMIPASVTSIGEWAFDDCSSLRSIDVAENNANYSSLDGVVYNKEMTELIRCPGGRSGSFTIPYCVTSIGAEAFGYCSNLTNVIIPSSLTSIGKSAFAGCKGLTSVNLPDSVTSIGRSAFRGCSSLESIIIPSGITKVEIETFMKCSSLSRVTFPVSLSEIGKGAFYECKTRIDVYYCGTEDQWTLVTIGYDNDPIRNGIMHFNSSDPNPPSTPADDSHSYHFTSLVTAIARNEYGDMFLPVAVTYEDGSLVADGTVFRYFAPGVDGKNVSSSNGVIYLPFYGTDEDGDAEFLISKYGNGGQVVSSASFSIDILSKPLSYQEKYKTDLELSFEGKAADVLGAKTAPLYGTGFEYEVDNGVQKLTLSNKISGKLAGRVEAPKKLIASVSGSRTVSGERENTLTIENFDRNNALHKGLIGYYLLQELNIGKVTQTELADSFYQMYGVMPGEYENKTTKESVSVKLDADVPAFKVQIGDDGGKYTLSSPGVAMTFESSVKHDSGVSEVYTTKVKTDLHDFLAKGPWLLGLSSAIFCKDMSGNTVSVIASDFADDSKDTVAVSSEAFTSDVVAGWTEKDTTVSTVTYKGKMAADLFGSDPVIPSMLRGNAYFLTPSDLNTLLNQAETMMQADPLQNVADYSEKTKYTSTFEYSYSTGADVAKISLSGTGEKEYVLPTKSGVVFNGTRYLSNDTSFPEGTTWELGYDLPDLFALYADGLLSFFGKCIVYEAGKVVDGVIEGAAKIWGNVSEKWDVVVSSAKKSGASAESVKASTPARAMLADENGRKAMIADQAYTVRVFEDAEHSKEVSSSDLKTAPVKLTIDLSNEKTSIAGSISKVTIYHWNEDTLSYEAAPNQLRDQANHTITCDVTDNGEYVAAVDETAPEIVRFFLSEEDALEIVAVVNDFSDISGGSLKIDGKEAVANSAFAKYYDENTGVFRFAVSSSITGAHKAVLQITDEANNTTERTLQFVIDVEPTTEPTQPTTKPDDPTPPTTKPDDTKPAEPTTKPDDTKPSDTKPSDSKPADPKPTPKPIRNPFVDVNSGDYFYDPVLWALTHEPQITDGMTETTFAPGETCTRGQVVTFLWRAMGCAEPKSASNPFSDVAGGDYFYKAVLWAVEKGITDGTSATTFSPNDPCTRAHVVTFLHRAEGTPAAGSKNPFADVAAGEYYTNAVLWAVEKGITDGTSDTTFSPAAPCTRGQIVTFLYRDMK